MKTVIGVLIPYFSYVLPGTLLFLQWILKLSVDDTVSKISVTRSLLLLPIDIAFLSLSFIVAFTVVASGRNLVETVQVGLISIIIYLIFGIITIITSKRSHKSYELERNVSTIFLCLVSYLVSTFMIVYSVSLFREPL